MTRAGGLGSALRRLGFAALLVLAAVALWYWLSGSERGVADPDAGKDPQIACADRIERVPFGSNSAVLAPGSSGEQAVEAIARFTHDRIQSRAEPCRVTAVEIIGNADARGTATYNLALSRRRAAAVRTVLEQSLRALSGAAGAGLIAPASAAPSCGVVKDHTGQALSVYEDIEICHDGAGETHANQSVMTPEQWEMDRRATVTVRLRLKPFKRGLVTQTGS